jgi:SAM-dependent methyltransferase
MKVPHPGSTNRGLGAIRSFYPRQLLDVGRLRRDGLKVLDAGTGGGALVWALRRRGVDAHGLDLRLSRRQQRQPFFWQADMRRTFLDAEQFDLIFCTQSLLGRGSAVEAQRQALVELARLLKVGGHLRFSPATIKPHELEALVAGVAPLRVDAIYRPGSYPRFVDLVRVLRAAFPGHPLGGRGDSLLRPAGQRTCEPDLASGDGQWDAQTHAEPMRAGFKPLAPAPGHVELAYEVEHLQGCRVDPGGKLDRVLVDQPQAAFPFD